MTRLDKNKTMLCVKRTQCKSLLVSQKVNSDNLILLSLIFIIVIIASDFVGFADVNDKTEDTSFKRRFPEGV